MAVKKRLVIVGMGSIGKRHGGLLNQRSDIAVDFANLILRILRRPKR